MVSEIVSCPVCGGTTLDDAEPVYTQHYHPELVGGVHLNRPHVYATDTMRCRDCGRLFSTHGTREVDPDLIAARHTFTPTPSTLPAVSAAMRADHGPTHERHTMWAAMADLLELAGTRAPADIRQAAARVADAYTAPTAGA